VSASATSRFEEEGHADGVVSEALADGVSAYKWK